MTLPPDDHPGWKRLMRHILNAKDPAKDPEEPPKIEKTSLETDPKEEQDD